LDWFAGAGVQPEKPASVISGLLDDERRVSDHDPIVLTFTLSAVN